MSIFKKPNTTISISNETIIRTILFTIAAVIALQLISATSHQLTLIAVSGFLAIALNPAVRWITKKFKTKSRISAAGVAYLIVISVLISFIVLIVPPLVRQSSEFVQNIPETVESFRTQDSAIAQFVRDNNLDERLTLAAEDFADRLGEGDGPVLNTASRVGSTLISIITVLVLTFMILVEGPGLIDKAFSFTAKDKRAKRKELLGRMYKVVTAYVNGQVLIAAIAASFAFIFLLIASSILDANINAIALAGIVFIFGLIPLIGNILASVLVVLFCLFASPTLALITAIYFVLYQQIENITLQPHIQSRSNQLTPLIVFVAAILGAGVGGLLGALVAIPTAGCIKILVDDRFGKTQES